MEKFENCDEIDGIIIASVFECIDYLKELLKKYNISKVKAVVASGMTGQLSIFNGLNKACEIFSRDSVVLIHDGVRPFIDFDLIKKILKR